MSALLRSKAGYITAGIYLLVTIPVIILMSLIFLLRYSNNNTAGYTGEETINIATLILTLPWSIFATVVGVALPMHQGRLAIGILTVIGAIINATILYLLGYIVSKAFTYLLGKPTS